MALAVQYQDDGPSELRRALEEGFERVRFPCPHPAHRCRFDGLWEWEPEPMAALTCCDCGTSILVPVRDDVRSNMHLQQG